MEDIGFKALAEMATTVGAVGVLSWVTWAFMTGRIVARSIHDARIAEVNNDRDKWRDAHLALSGPVERVLLAAASRHEANLSGHDAGPDRPR